MENNSDFWKVLQEVNDAIKFAEAKAIAVISISGILTAFLFSKQDINKNYESDLVFVIFILCIVFLFACILFSLFCLKPSFKHKSKDSILYFNSIVENYNSTDKLQIELERVCGNQAEMKKQLTEQIYTKSHIAKQKFKYNTLSIFFFISFLITILILVIVK